ncbi:MAG TPA: heavy metal translocating P-type ATPase [Candidatus Lumbricidophila sp.]|nr:heavy metal translocating P-type ATPase [Candidatus Lumbricidophila sp.]
MERTVDLQIEGMTCASCALRIERKLQKLPGVTATVNYATDKAHVTLPPGTELPDVVAAVEAAGYRAAAIERPRQAHPAPPTPAPVHMDAHEHMDAPHHPGMHHTPPTQAPESDAPVGSGIGPGGSPAQPGGGLSHPGHLVPATNGHAHAHAHDHATGNLKPRLITSTVLAIPVVALSMIPALQFNNWQWLAFALAGPVAVWGAAPFHRAAWVNLRHGGVTMDTLISLGVIAAFGWSTYALFFGGAGMHGMQMEFEWISRPGDGANHLYLEVAAGVTVFLLAGRYIEDRSKTRSQAALQALLDGTPAEVSVLRDGIEVRIALADLNVGDHFIVRPGERIATDAQVIDGHSSVDQSIVTGESVPVDVEPGASIVGGTVNIDGRLIARATRVGADTELATMARLVEQAQAGKADVQRLADRISLWFVPVVIGLSVVTFIGWFIATNDVISAFTAAVATLIVACPCALGLATPTALLVGTGRAAQLGIVIKGPQILESTRRVDTVVLDKTGTITTGRMTLTEVVATRDGSTEAVTIEEVLRLAGAVEYGSEHPIAAAISRAALEAGPLPAIESFSNDAGHGVQAIVDGHLVTVGRPSWQQSRWSLTVPADLTAEIDRLESAGGTVVTVAWDGAVRGAIAVADTPKPTSADAIRRLRALGLTPVLATGDNERAARAVAAAVGIDEVRSGLRPAEKADFARELQSKGRVVAMVGDGVNDAVALATADLGIAMGTGTDVAIEASDLTVVHGDVRAVADAIALSRATLRTIKGNLFWAFAYNVAAIPIAMLGLLNPLVAGAAMAFSSVFVVTNSLRLRRFRSA